MDNEKFNADVNNKGTKNKFTADSTDDIYNNYNVPKDSDSILDAIDRWTLAHPNATTAIILAGATFIGWRISKALLVSAVFAANKKTLNYVDRMYY